VVAVKHRHSGVRSSKIRFGQIFFFFRANCWSTDPTRWVGSHGFQRSHIYSKQL